MSRLIALTALLTAAAPQGQYTVATDTVTDTRTALVWQRAPAPGTRDWPTALQYCEALSLAGQADWRLPSLKELNSIVEDRATPPKIDPVAFPSTPNSLFWTSTPYSGGGGYATYVHFANGTSGYAGPAVPYAVRCVRGG